MSDITQWSPIDEDAANRVPAPDGFPEPMAAGGVNNSARAIMGSVRRHADDGGWFDHGHNYAFVGPVTFTVNPGEDLSNVYQVARRVRVQQSPDPTMSGYIRSYDFPSGQCVLAPDDASDVLTVSMNNAGSSVSVGSKPQASSAPFTMILPPGLICPYGGVGDGTTGAPDGWLWCSFSEYNAAVDRSLVPLYEVIGNSFGGTDETNFRVPDMRGRVPAGYHNSGTPRLTNPDASIIGDTGGDEFKIITTANLPPHTHDYQRGEWDGTTNYDSDGTTGNAFNQPGSVLQTGNGGFAQAGLSVVQDTIITNYIIKK